MRKTILIATLAIFFTTMLNAQTYSTLWKQVKDAQEKDLPQTEQEVLTQIVTKAEKEKAYGQLLKAELQRAKSQCEVAPDSLKPAVEQLIERAEQAEGNHVLQAVYYAVLGYIYYHNSWLDELRHTQIGQDYYDKAMAYPEELAAVKATDYEPFVVKGQDSRYYGDDLLSVIGIPAGHARELRNYYLKTGNRLGTLFASESMLIDEEPEDIESEPLDKSKYIQRLDSLIAEYQDLPECGELAIDRYEYMEDHTDATAEQKWQYINMALERWGTWHRMNYLRNQQRELTAPQFDAVVKRSVNIPQRPQPVTLSELRSINELTMRVYKVDVNGDTELNPASPDHYKKLKPLLHALPEMTQTKKFVGKREYEFFEDSMQLGGLPVGVYMLEFESQPATRTTRSLYFVSDLRIMVQQQPSAKNDGQMEKRIVVVNATTGQPVKNATVDVRWGYRRNAGSATLKTDAKGECTLKMEENMRDCHMRAHTTADNACPEMDEWGRFNHYDVDETNLISIYTDRSIYRPGQTVHAAVIYYRNYEGNDNRALPNEELTIRLKDANYQTVEEQTVTTDQYGTASASFILPTQGLAGQFTINVRGESHTIRVEEYKRPSFEVDIPRVTQDYEAGDTVEAVGHVRSYAGVPVQGATVKYKVVRRQAFWWMSYSRYWQYGYIGTGSDDTLLAEGETTTDDKGEFTAAIPLVLPQTLHPMFYNYVITADVTDQAGETHQGTMSLPLGNRKTALSVTLPEKVLNEEGAKMTFHLQNAAGADLEGKVRYRFDNGSWQEAKANAPIAIPSLRSGNHTLMAICQEDTVKQDFIVFSLNDKRPVTDMRSWFYTSSEHFPMDGKPVTVQVGSSDKDVHVVYGIFSGGKLIESGTADLSNELINRKFTYKNEYGHGLLLTFGWVKNGEYYVYHTTIKKPLPDKHLNVKWKTFRNRLTPGQQEEWTLTVVKPDGTPADAQVMATLYDKSLDQLYAHSWSLLPPTRLQVPYTNWTQAHWGAIYCHGYKNPSSLDVPQQSFSHFDTNVFPSYNYYRRFRVDRRMARSNVMMEEKVYDVVEEAAAADEDDVLEEVAYGVQSKKLLTGSVTTVKEEPQQAEMQMRENLQETAFFMPQLTTDATGTVSLKFTLPESLTTWHFLGIAHTKDMMYGQLTDEAVARKDVMIQPNMPRFLRQDDKGTISARVMNMSDKPIEGTAMLQLLDPETEKVVYEQKQQVSVADSSTIAVTFPVKPSTFNQQQTLLIARVSISTPTHSDGEQHYLPMLPSTERVTVTVPFTQNGPGTKNVDLKSLFSVKSLVSSDVTVNREKSLINKQSTLNHQLTVEYTNNPAWLMIQALPAVGHPHDDCAVCQATSFYANAIGRHILAQNPTAKNVFEQWKRESTQLTSLSSQLQKNEELKDLLLNETPWVMDANREQEQKQQLGTFFDKNVIDLRLTSAIDKLGKLQNGDGSWSWWPGMDGSTYITTAVTEMLVRLNKMTEQQDETEEMLANAFTFLGSDIVELVNIMKKEERKGHKQSFPTFRALQWLYICAIDGRELPKNVNDANTYLKDLLKKETKNQTIYEKALSAIILENKSYVKSLKEWTVYREDMGRYYDTQRAGYSWRDYKMPTQVAAIEAMKLLTPNDTTTITEMQRWLLQQKRTQAWDTPLNSVDAIYAFLNGDATALAPQAKTELCIDNKPIDISDATAGIGYVKTSVPLGDEVPSTFSAKKTSTGTSWGAVYAQFTQPTRDIADQTSGISVKRELLSVDGLLLSDVTSTPNDKSHSTLNSQHSSLKVGDRIIMRITIEADRDYDFVQVNDKRAACMEPVKQLSGYNWREGYYCTPKDYATNYFFDRLAKGRHIIETEYYIDRIGTYETGTCTVQCAYSPEFRGTTKSITLEVMSDE